MLAGQCRLLAQPAQGLQKSKLLVQLPDYCPTPDGMAIDKDGDLVVACPNFAEPEYPGCLIKVDAKLKVRKWVDVPVLKETGRACPMGIAFGPDGDLYVCKASPPKPFDSGGACSAPPELNGYSTVEWRLAAKQLECGLRQRVGLRQHRCA